MADGLTESAALVRRFFEEHRPGLKLPDGWFGRPFDNQHQLSDVTVRDDGLEILLDDRLRLVLHGPVQVQQSGKNLVLAGFDHAEWERQEYGSSGRVHRREYSSGTVEFVVAAG